MNSFNQILNYIPKESTSEILKKTKDSMMENYGKIFLFILIMFGVLLAAGLVLGAIPGNNLLINYIGQFINSTLTSTLGAGILVYGMHLKLRKKTSVELFFKGFKQFPQFLIYTILSYVVAFVVMIPIILILALVLFLFIGSAIFDANITQQIPVLMEQYAFLMIAVFIICLVAAMLFYIFISHTTGLIACYELKALEALKLSYLKVKQNFKLHLFVYLRLFLFFIGLASIFMLFMYNINPIAGGLIFSILGIFFLIPYMISFQMTMFNAICVNKNASKNKGIEFEDEELLDA